MKKTCFALLFVFITAARAADPARNSVSSEDISGLPPGVLTSEQEALTLMHEGDALYAQRTSENGASEALVAYKKAIGKNAGLVEAYWKSSRACYWIADHATNTKEKIRVFEEGIDIAKKAIELDPDCVEAHFWLGGNYGSYGETRGILKSLSLVKPIRHEMEEVLRIDPNYQGGGGYRVLGIVDYKVPAFVGGNKKRALEHLEKALSIDPKNPFNNYYMAEYLEIVGERYRAFDHLKTLESAETSADVDGPDLKMIQARGAKLKKKMNR